MSDTMPRRRKINTRVGRLAARERVRQLVSAHDDQVVLLIWGGRVLGWSLRRIAALEGSAAPPGRRAGYTAGNWTAAAVQRICRRHGIPTDRPRAAAPRRARLSQRRSRPRPLEGKGKCKGPAQLSARRRSLRPTSGDCHGSHFGDNPNPSAFGQGAENSLCDVLRRVRDWLAASRNGRKTAFCWASGFLEDSIPSPSSRINPHI